MLVKGLKLIALLFFALTSMQAASIKVGYTDNPPYVYSEEGALRGIHYALWEKVAESLKYETEYVQFESAEQLQTAVDSSKVMVGLDPFLITESLLKRHDVSIPTYINKIGIATKYDFKHRNWYKAMLSIISYDFIKVSILVGVVIFLFGFFMWIAERNKNTDHFHDSRKGLVDSFWWSAVTMTTVGYGDKYPVTFSGKMIALIWMFTAMIIISSLTAGITMILTVSNLSSGITDVESLERLNVGTVNGSTAEVYISTHVPTNSYGTFTQAMEDLSSDDLDVIVYDKAKIRHYINANKLHQDYEMLPVELKKELVSFIYAKSFDNQKRVNVAVANVKSSLHYPDFLQKEGLK